jgi:TPR repeat protein
LKFLTPTILATDPKLAFKFCRMAAEGGHAACQRDLGTLYSRVEGVERDDRKAAAWYLRAAEGGDSEGQFVTGQRYKFGDGHDAPNIKEAAKWYKKAAFQGHCAAQFHLGLCYDHGNSVYKNPGLALKLWRKCAQRHETDAKTEGYDYVAAAQHNIGNCYRRGSGGLEVDMPMAMQWWTKAAERGFAMTQRDIGQIYLMGFIEESSRRHV